ncbi:MAG: hypothetical protein PHY16_19075 [Methylobacter sp.]|nr:hypothetical protein [Methylobacter sp.]
MNIANIWSGQVIKVGSVVHTDHTSIKGFNRTQSGELRDSDGKVIVDVSW